LCKQKLFLISYLQTGLCLKPNQEKFSPKFHFSVANTSNHKTARSEKKRMGERECVIEWERGSKIDSEIERKRKAESEKRKD